MIIKQHKYRFEGIESDVTGVMFLAVMRDATLLITYQGFSCCFLLLNPFSEGEAQRVAIRLRTI